MLDCKGYVPISVAKIRNIGLPGKNCLDVIPKMTSQASEEDADLWQIIGIPAGLAARISLSIELAEIAEWPTRRAQTVLPKSNRITLD